MFMSSPVPSLATVVLHTTTFCMALGVKLVGKTCGMWSCFGRMHEQKISVLALLQPTAGVKCLAAYIISISVFSICNFGASSTVSADCSPVVCLGAIGE
jgi:hypothetical protein